jgi:hypothetical protein
LSIFIRDLIKKVPCDRPGQGKDACGGLKKAAPDKRRPESVQQALYVVRGAMPIGKRWLPGRVQARDMMDCRRKKYPTQTEQERIAKQ